MKIFKFITNTTGNDRIIIMWFISCLIGVHSEPAFLSAFLLIMLIKGRNIFKSKFTLFIMGLFVHGFIMSMFTGYDLWNLLRITLLLTICLLGYSQIFQLTPNRDVGYWFEIYMRFAFILAVLGIIEYSVKLATGINLFPNTIDMVPIQKDTRLHSIIVEAGTLAPLIAPAVSLIIISKNFFKENTKPSIIILVAAICTFSTGMYFAIVIALMIRFVIFFKKLKYVLIVFIVCYVSNIVSSGVLEEVHYSDYGSKFEKIYGKLAESLVIFTDGSLSPYDFENLNISTYATLTNYWVALNAPMRITGTGLGSHRQNYESLYKSDFELYGLNADEGYSLFNRIFSEFGFIGLIVYFYFILYKRYNKRNILSTCLLIAIITLLIRGGAYTVYCTAMFHIWYYKCKDFNLEDLKIKL